MKKLFTLIAMCLLGVGAMQADSLKWNFDNQTTGTLSKGTTITLTQTTGETLKYTTTSDKDAISEASKEIGGITYAKYLSITNSTDITGARVLSLSGISGSGYLTIAFRTLSPNKDETGLTGTVTLKDSEGTELGSVSAAQADVPCAVLSQQISNLDASKTYYLITSRKMGIAGVIWTPTTGCVYTPAGDKSITLTTSNVPSSITMPTSGKDALTSIKYNDDITISATDKTFTSGNGSYKYDTSVPLQIVKNNVVTIVPAEGVSITSAKVYGTVAANSLTEGTTYQIVDDNDNTNAVSMNLRNTTYSAENWKSITLSGDTKKFHVTNNSAYVAIEIEYITPASAEVKVVSIKWASLYLPFNATIPSGVKAYYAKSSTENTVTLSEITGAIPANTGVVVNAETGVYTLNEAATSVDPISGNLFEGYTTDQTFTENQGYVLAGASDDKTSPIFQMYAKDAVLAAYKAYLPKSNVPSVGTAKVSFVFDNSTTAINAVSSSKVQAPATRKAMVNGRMVVITANGTYNVAGARIK